MLAGIDTNFTVTAKAADDADFGELYVFKWTTVLIPPTTILIVNLVGVVAGFSDALNSGYESWGPLFGCVLGYSSSLSVPQGYDGSIELDSDHCCVVVCSFSISFLSGLGEDKPIRKHK